MSERPVRMTVRTARRLAITKQHLAGPLSRYRGPDSIMELMRDIRYLQLDPTSSVAPSHLLVLWSRLGDFRESDLDRLLWKDRQLFEYWAHKASIVLTEDYPLYSPRMKGFYQGELTWDKRIREWMAENTALRDYVVKELRTRGPLFLRDLDDVSGDAWDRARVKWGLKASAWSSGRSVSRMLDFLFHDGTIMVAGRSGRQKLWDLSERFLPPKTPKEKLTEAEVEYLGAQLSLRALGVATPKQIAWHFLERRYPNLRATMKALQSDSKVRPVVLSDGDKPSGQFYIHSEDVNLAEALAEGDWEPRTTLLSPFDNLITDKDRTEELFGFFFRLEIYTPRTQRQHGYYVLPILDGDRFIGRVDPLIDRKGERLLIHSVHAEADAPKGRAVARRIGDAIEGLAEFLGAKEVVYPRSIPEAWKTGLR